MVNKLCLLVSLLAQICWAQSDTSYQPMIGERAAALPHPQPPVPRGDDPHRGGGGIHGGGIHQHGRSSNRELAISLMHVADDLKKFSNDVESRLNDMFNILEELKKEQQQVTNLVMVLAYGGVGSFRGKRSTDEYESPVHTEYYDPEYTTTESPPYSPNPPAHDSYSPMTTYSTESTKNYNPMNAYSTGSTKNYNPVDAYSTESTENYNPMDAWKDSSSSSNVYDDLPGTVSKRRFVGSSGSWSSRGYSGYTATADSPSYSTARPFKYVNMPSFYQVRETVVDDEDIEELEYVEYAI